MISSRPMEGVLQLTLSRPESRNAFNMEMMAGVLSALSDASKDETIRAVVVTGDPRGKAFCAGADLTPGKSGFAADAKQEKQKPVAKQEKQRQRTMDQYRDEGGYVTLAALHCTKPVIAAINGAAVGIGLAFPVACDIRVVAQDAKVGFPMAARGLVCESCSSCLLPRLVGTGIAKELVFTGRVFYARDAPVGLFNYILPQDQVLPKALELAREIATTTSGLSVAMCKQLIDHGWDSTPEEAMLNESKCLFYVNTAKTEDVKEGVTSFREKRQPKWVHDAWHDLPDFLPFGTRIDVRPGRSRL